MVTTDKELKALILKESRKAVKNFIEEVKGSSTTNAAPLVPLNEVNAKSLIARHSENGYIVISACRSDFDELGIDSSLPNAMELRNKVNNERTRSIINDIKKSGYSYTPVYGGFIENFGEENSQHVYERSFIVYNRDKSGKSGDFKKLFNFGVALCCKYNQDSVLVKAPNDTPKYIKQDGSVDMQFTGNVAFDDISQKYFTDLHKNSASKIGNGGKPSRFSYIFEEAYINPAPAGYSERVVRSSNGEIFLNDFK
jgi:hypothetical protein